MLETLGLFFISSISLETQNFLCPLICKDENIQWSHRLIQNSQMMMMIYYCWQWRRLIVRSSHFWVTSVLLAIVQDCSLDGPSKSLKTICRTSMDSSACGWVGHCRFENGETLGRNPFPLDCVLSTGPDQNRTMMGAADFV